MGRRRADSDDILPPRDPLQALRTDRTDAAMFSSSLSDVKEDFAPPLSGMPGQFPVYLRLPYRRDSYFCFRQQAKQDAFLSILSDCIRHQNRGETRSTSLISPETI